MKIINNIEQIIKEYSKEFAQIENEFNKQNDKFKALSNKNHDLIGKILKYHLITENYLNEFLNTVFSNVNIENVNLRYHQKINLLPDDNPKTEFIKNGLKELNKVRNKFSHDLNATVKKSDLPEMLKVLKIARKKTEYNDSGKIIADFTAIACTFLIVDSAEVNLLLDKIFNHAK